MTAAQTQESDRTKQTNKNKTVGQKKFPKKLRFKKKSQNDSWKHLASKGGQETNLPTLRNNELTSGMVLRDVRTGPGLASPGSTEGRECQGSVSVMGSHWRHQRKSVQQESSCCNPQCSDSVLKNYKCEQVIALLTLICESVLEIQWCVRVS